MHTLTFVNDKLFALMLLSLTITRSVLFAGMAIVHTNIAKYLAQGCTATIE